MAKARKRSNSATAWIAPPAAETPRRRPSASRTPTYAIDGEPPRLKALSLRQPWAEEVLRGAKVEEYRTLPTKIRGTIYIYASRCRWPAAVEEEHTRQVGYDVVDLPRGALVGTVEIVGCRPRSDGLYAWQLARPRRLATFLMPLEKPQPIWFHPFGRP